MALRIVHPAEGWNQNQQRSVAIYFDQHRSKGFPDGRPYWCYVENPADPKHNKFPVGDLIPITQDKTLADGTVLKGWSAPWLPEQKYFTMAVGMMAGNRFKLAYDRMIVDYRAAAHRYYTSVAREAAARNWPAPKLYGAVSFQLRAIMGEPPKSPKLPEGALAEDPWLLGFDTRVNEQLNAIIMRERDQMVVTLDEAGLDEAPTPVSHVNPLAGMSAEDIADLTQMLAEQRAKKARATSRPSRAKNTAA